MEIASGRLVRSKDVGNGFITLTEDGRNFLNITPAGQIRFYDVQSLLLQRQWQIPRKGTLLAASSGKLILVKNFESKDRPIECYTIRDDGQLSLLWSRNQGWARFSSNQSRLFIPQDIPKTDRVTCEVFALNNDTVSPLPEITFEGMPLAVSPDGEIIFACTYGTPNYFFVNGKTGETYALGTPWQFGLNDYSFTPDGKAVESSHYPGEIITYSAATGKAIRQQKLPGALRLLNLSFSATHRFAAAEEDNVEVRVWDRDNGRLLARFPDHRLIRYSLLIAFVVWCAAWVCAGLRLPHPRPWLDVALMNAAPLCVLVLHAATRPLMLMHPIPLQVGLGLLASIMGMIVAWCILSEIRWTMRLAGIVASISLVAGILTMSAHSDTTVFREGIRTTLLGSVGYTLVLVLLLKFMRWYGLRLINSTPANGPAYAAVNVWWQVPLRDLLLITGSIALALAAARSLVPGGIDKEVLIYVISRACLLAVAIILCILAALARKHALIYVLLALLGSVFLAFVPAIQLSSSNSEPLNWTTTVFAIATSTVLLSFSVFRLHGYQLEWRKAHGSTESTAP